MSALPSDSKGLLKKGLELIDQCRSSVGQRAAAYRQLALMAGSTCCTGSLTGVPPTFSVRQN